MFGQRMPVRLLRLTLSILLIGIALGAAAQTFKEFTDPRILSGLSGPSRIALGLDGNLWFSNYYGGSVWRATSTGQLTEFQLPGFVGDLYPNGIASAADSNIWVNSGECTGGGGSMSSRVWRVTPSGLVTTFDTSTCSTAGAIAQAPDTNLWFGCESSSSLTNPYGVCRMTLSGALTQFAIISPNRAISGIVAGQDGNLWFTQQGRIGRITPAGSATEFVVPAPNTFLGDIAMGADGNLWFAERPNQIGKITQSGVITEFLVPTAGSNPQGITSGPDGNIWFTEESANKIARITPSGAITEFSMPKSSQPGPYGIITGPDGALWFTTGRSVVQFLLPPTAPARHRAVAHAP